MKLLAAVLISIMAGIPLSSKADSETWALISCCSKHWRTGENKYQEQNYGLSLDYTFANRDSLILGSYRNSFDRTSSYVAYGLQTWEARVLGLRVESRVLFGGRAGYGDSEEQRQHYQPLIAPVVTVRGLDVGVMIFGVPGIILGLGFEVRLP